MHLHRMWPFAFCVWISSLIFSIVFRFKDFFASVQRVSSKTDNNRTAGEGTCYELGTIQCIKSAVISNFAIDFCSLSLKSQKTFRCPRTRDPAGQCDPFRVAISCTKQLWTTRIHCRRDPIRVAVQMLQSASSFPQHRIRRCTTNNRTTSMSSCCNTITIIITSRQRRTTITTTIT